MNYDKSKQFNDEYSELVLKKTRIRYDLIFFRFQAMMSLLIVLGFNPISILSAPRKQRLVWLIFIHTRITMSTGMWLSVNVSCLNSVVVGALTQWWRLAKVGEGYFIFNFSCIQWFRKENQYTTAVYLFRISLAGEHLLIIGTCNVVKN